jgi:ABC-type nitrate/sulfonate/bicarbonate transport system substrate-binding protein
VAPTAAAREMLTVRFAQSTPAISFAALYVARDKGFFEQQGVKLDFVELQSAVAKGAALVAVQNTSDMTQEVCARKDFIQAKGVSETSPLRDRLAALKGATISITGPGSASDRGMRWLLIKYGGLDPNTDVQLVQIGGAAAVVGAIEQNRVQAYLQSPPNCEVSAARGITVVLIRPDEVPEFQNYIHEVLYTSKDYAAKNGEALSRVATALSMGNSYLTKHPDESVALLQKAFKDVPPEIIESSVRRVILPQIKADGRMTRDGWIATNIVLLESGQIDKPLDISEGGLWTNQYIREFTVP